jgi:ProP effector
MLEHVNLPEEEVAPSDAAPPVADLSPAACAARLAELFPAVFSPGAPKPLKLRIQADIQQRAPGIFTRKVLSAFLHRHTTSNAYIKALLNSPQRFDLDGAPSGDIAAAHRDAATAELQRRRTLHEARRAAEREAQRNAQRAAQSAERAAFEAAQRERALQDEQRRERQALLRAFEASPLSRSNFCALKGLPEADLDALLAQARQERQEFAPPAVNAAAAPRPGSNAPRRASGPQAPRRHPGGGPRNP